MSTLVGARTGEMEQKAESHSSARNWSWPVHRRAQKLLWRGHPCYTATATLPQPAWRCKKTPNA
ncbi:hypothetical protein IF1G_04184 [Cordyceps javanica]|uniref:Uncharacterized protein n=1 Tax=Cordyceps javanica TaxID=43265 RepID=A0A545V5E4_9HYPO|nr:hypothetical protein IF1G_04184 [Cordyceps javanica]